MAIHRVERASKLYLELGPLFEELTSEWMAIATKLLKEQKNLFSKTRHSLNQKNVGMHKFALQQYPSLYLQRPTYRIVTPTLGLSSCLAHGEHIRKVSEVSVALHHVLFILLLASKNLVNSPTYKEILKQQRALNVSLPNTLQDTVIVFRTVLLNSTAMLPQEERLELLNYLVNNRAIDSRFARFDSVIAAFAATAGGFWAKFEDDFITDGIYQRDESYNLVASSRFFDLLRKNIKEDMHFIGGANFSGGCPVAHSRQPQKESAVTRMGKFIVKEVEKMISHPDFSNQVKKWFNTCMNE